MQDFWEKNKKLNKKEFEELAIYLKSFPLDISLPFITYCDAKCLFCSYWKFRKKIYMNLSEIKLYKELFKYLCYVGINPAGEPLLHPEFEKTISYIRRLIDNRCIFYLVTNGIKLNRKLSTILDNINALTISINAASSDTHEIVMGVKDSFRVVLKNIELLINEKIKRNTKMEVYFAFVVLKQNIHEIPEVINLASKFGIDKVYLRTLATGNDNNPIKPYSNPNYFKIHPRNHPRFYYYKELAEEAIGNSKVPVEADIENWEKEIVVKGNLTGQKEIQLSFTRVDTFGEKISEIPTKGWVRAEEYGISLPLRCQYLYKYMIDPRLSNIQPVCVYMEVLPGFNPIALDLKQDFMKKIRNSPAMIELRRALKEGPYIPETCTKCNILSAFKHSK